MRPTTASLAAFALLSLLAASTVNAHHFPRSYRFDLKPGHHHPDPENSKIPGNVAFDGLYILSQYSVSGWAVYVNEARGTFLAYTTYDDWSLGTVDMLDLEHDTNTTWEGTDIYNDEIWPEYGWNDYTVSVDETDWIIPHGFVFTAVENHTEETIYSGLYRRTSYIIHGREVYVNEKTNTFLASTVDGKYGLCSKEYLDSHVNGTDFTGSINNAAPYVNWGWKDYSVHIVYPAALGFQVADCNALTVDRDGLFLLSKHIINDREVFINHPEDLFVAFTTFGVWAQAKLEELPEALSSPTGWKGPLNHHGEYNRSPYVDEDWNLYFVAKI